MICVLLLASSLPPGRQEKLKAGAVVLAVSQVVASPWFIRNLLITGNPVAPMFQRLFHQSGAEYFDRLVIDQQIAFSRLPGMGRGVLDFLALPWNLTMRCTPGRYQDSFGFQIGPPYLIGTIACVFLGTALRNRLVSLMLKAALLLSMAWFWSSQESRFLMPVFPLLAFAGAAAFDELLSRSGPSRAALIAVPLYTLLYCQWPVWNRSAHRYGYALGQLSTQGLEDLDPASAVGRRRGGFRPGPVEDRHLRPRLDHPRPQPPRNPGGEAEALRPVRSPLNGSDLLRNQGAEFLGRGTWEGPRAVG